MRSSNTVLAINELILGLKFDGLWPKIKELYLLSGCDYKGLTTKIKGYGNLTLNSFTSTNYKATGNTAGLKGSGGDIDCNIRLNTNGGVGLFVFVTEIGVSTNMVLIGADSGYPNNMIDINGNFITSSYQARCAISPLSIFFNGRLPGFLHANRSSTTLFKCWINGNLSEINTTSTANFSTSNTLRIFSRSGDSQSDGTIAFAGVSSGTWSDTDALNFSIRINTLMRKFGINAYLNPGVYDIVLNNDPVTINNEPIIITV